MFFVLFAFQETLSLFIRNIISLHPLLLLLLWTFFFNFFLFLSSQFLRSYFIRTAQRIQYNKVDVRYYHVGIHNSFELQKNIVCTRSHIMCIFIRNKCVHSNFHLYTRTYQMYFDMFRLSSYLFFYERGEDSKKFLALEWG